MGDDSLFRRGPNCLRLGIEEAVKQNKLVPIGKISPLPLEKDLAALEVIKLHQLVITQNQEEDLLKNIEPSDALDEESIDDAVACLIATTDETVENESWLSNKSSGYRAQKATQTVRERVRKVEEFSNYLMSPLRKRYDVFFRSMMVAFKAIRCWLRMKPSDEAPKNWTTKRREIDERIMNLTRCPNKEATIEEANIEETTENEKEEYRIGNNKTTIVRNLSRMEIGSRSNDIKKVLEYNILKRKSDENIQVWKSFAGL